MSLYNMFRKLRTPHPTEIRLSWVISKKAAALRPLHPALILLHTGIGAKPIAAQQLKAPWKTIVALRRKPHAEVLRKGG